MKRIILWYNANRKTIWKIIGVIVVAYAILQLAQYIWKQNQIAQRDKGTLPNNNDTNSVTTKLNSITLGEDKVVVTGEKVTTGQSAMLEIIDKFVGYCNNNQINEAYNLLSDECKNEMYPKVENFKNSYYNTIFAGKKKNISMENWVGNIYKIKYMNDALSTGIYEQENTIQDYVTIVSNQEGQTKLNINNYIGKEEIEREVEAYGIKIKAVEKNTYMDYVTYTFDVTNYSENPILLNDRNDTENMYIEDINGIKYKAYTHEIAEAELQLKLKESKRVKIKYYSKYSSSKRIKNVTFNKVILKYNAYINYQNPGYYKDYGVIQINL